ERVVPRSVGAHPVAVAGDVDDDAAMQEPIEHRGGDGGVVEDVAPGADPAVGVQDDRAALVALRDHLEQRVGVFGGHGQVAELVDDQHGRPVEEPHGGGPASFDGGLAAPGGEIGGGRVVGA